MQAQTPVQPSLILYGLQGELRQPAQSTCLNLRLLMLNASTLFLVKLISKTEKSTLTIFLS